MGYFKQILSLSLIFSIAHSNFAFAGRHGSEGYASDGDEGPARPSLPRTYSVPLKLHSVGTPPTDEDFRRLQRDKGARLRDHAPPPVGDLGSGGNSFSASYSSSGSVSAGGDTDHDPALDVARGGYGLFDSLTAPGIVNGGEDNEGELSGGSSSGGDAKKEGVLSGSGNPATSGSGSGGSSGTYTDLTGASVDGSTSASSSSSNGGGESSPHSTAVGVGSVPSSGSSPGGSLDPSTGTTETEQNETATRSTGTGTPPRDGELPLLVALAGDERRPLSLPVLIGNGTDVGGTGGSAGVSMSINDGVGGKGNGVLDGVLFGGDEGSDSTAPLLGRRDELGGGDAGRDVELGLEITLETFKAAQAGDAVARASLVELFQPVLEMDEEAEAAAERRLTQLLADMKEYAECMERTRTHAGSHRVNGALSADETAPLMGAAVLPGGLGHDKAQDRAGAQRLQAVTDMGEGGCINGLTPQLAVANGTSGYGTGLPAGLPPQLRELLGDDEEIWRRFTGATTYVHDTVFEDRLTRKQKIMMGVGIFIAVWAAQADGTIFSDGLRYVLISLDVSKNFLNSNATYAVLYGSAITLVSVLNSMPQLASCAKSYFSSSTCDFIQPEYRWPQWKVRLAKLGVAIPISLINWFYFSYAIFEYWEDAKELNAQGQHNNLKQFPVALGVFSPAVLLKYGMIGWGLATIISKGPFKRFFGGRDLPLDSDSHVRQYRVEGLRMCTRLLHGIEHLPEYLLDVMYDGFMSLKCEDSSQGKMLFALQMHRLMTQYDAVLKLLEIIPDEDEREVTPAQHRFSMGNSAISLPMALVGFWLVYELAGTGVAQIPEHIAAYSSWAPAVLTLFVVFPWLYHAVVEFFEDFWYFRQGPHDSHTFPTERTVAHYWSGGEGAFRSITEVALTLQVAEKLPGGDTLGGKLGYLAAGSPFIGAHALGNMAELGGPYNDLTSFRASLKYGPERRICGRKICGGNPPTREYKQDVLHRVIARYKEFLRTVREDVLSTHKIILEVVDS